MPGQIVKNLLDAMHQALDNKADVAMVFTDQRDADRAFNRACNLLSKNDYTKVPGNKLKLQVGEGSIVFAVIKHDVRQDFPIW